MTNNELKIIDKTAPTVADFVLGGVIGVMFLLGLASIFLLLSKINLSAGIPTWKDTADQEVVRAVITTITFWLTSLGLQLILVLPVTLSVRRLTRQARIALLLPFCCGTIAPTMAFYIFFATGGLGPGGRLGLFDWTPGRVFIISAIDAWQWVGVLTIVLYARIERIPQVFFDQAAVDGVPLISTWRRLVFPEIRGVVLLYSLFKIFDWFQKGEHAALMFKENVTTQTLSALFQKRYSFATSLTAWDLLLQLAITLMFVHVIAYFLSRSPARGVSS